MAEAVPFVGMAAKFIGALVVKLNAVRANDALFATLRVRLTRLQRALGDPGTDGEDLKMTASEGMGQGGTSRVDDANWQSQAKSVLAAAKALIDRAEAASKTWVGFGARVLFSSPLKAQVSSVRSYWLAQVLHVGYGR